MRTATAVASPSAPRHLVIPVRFAAAGRVVQTTSTHLSDDGVEILAPLPGAGLIVGLKLYLPGTREPVPAEAIARQSAVAETGSFWAEFTDLAAVTRAEIALLVASANATGQRVFERVAVQTPVVLRGRDGAVDGIVTNLSASGMFVQTGRVASLGKHVRGELQLFDSDGPQSFEAEVVRITEQGAGMQFAGGSDAFRQRIGAYLAAMRR